MELKTKSIIKEACGYGLACLLFVALLEFSIGFLLDHAELLRFNPDNLLRKYYLGVDRNIIQYQPDCARYDSALGYTLKPGECRFRNREFDTAYSINHLGMRDDETSLAAPDIIVLGDSYAMGWGVQQHETFAQIIEQKTGLKVLNAAMSSYGTAREIKSLSRVPLQRAKLLIIQYCSNDYQENSVYAQHDNQLPIMSEADYDKTVKRYQRKKRYVFGGRAWYLLRSLARGSLTLMQPPPMVPPGAVSREDEARVFLNVLLHAPVDLGGLAVAVFEVSELGNNNDRFITSLKQQIAATPQPMPSHIMPLDLTNQLGSDAFFVLDDHLNARGHAAIADALLDSIHQHDADVFGRPIR